MTLGFDVFENSIYFLNLLCVGDTQNRKYVFVTHKTQNMCLPETEYSRVRLKYRSAQGQAAPHR